MGRRKSSFDKIALSTKLRVWSPYGGIRGEGVLRIGGQSNKSAETLRRLVVRLKAHLKRMRQTTLSSNKLSFIINSELNYLCLF